MMSEKQYRVARKSIVEQIKLAQKLHCTNLAKKHSAALKKLELRFLQPDATGCKTFIAYTTDDIGDKWSLIYNIESLEQFGQWLVSGGYKENSNYKK